MYLKSIEVQGFKSFANKIVFDFHNGITGIVGPNGSGKSNVADAVRWVLGEQSAKQLRGSKMEDVIFAGTQNRKPLGFAYVAITLDNSDKALNIAYDEVTVSRKVYRSGESEYKINGSDCRLKDINELFYDTGIGKEGYSIIGQGQIDKILSGKPEERRELFDEAAGIVKFKKRKASAIKNLDTQRANLVRVNDIIGELEHQVGPLERESEKAKEYLKLKDEQKRYDVNMFLIEAERLKKEEDELNANLGIVRGHLDEERGKVEEYKEAFDEYEERIRLNGEAYEENMSSLNDNNIALNNSLGRIDIINEQINTARVNDAHIKERRESLLVQKDAKEKELGSYEKEYESKKEDSDKLAKAIENATAEISVMQDSIREKEAKLEGMKAELINIMNEKAEHKSKLQRFEATLEQINIRKAALNSKLIKGKSDQQGLQDELNSLKAKEEVYERDIEELKVTNKELENEITRVRGAIGDMNISIDKAQKDVHVSNSRYESLRNLSERYDGYNNSIKKVMELKNSKVRGVVADIIHVDKKYEVALEIALGGSIQNIVTDDTDTAKKIILYLKENKLGRATFLPIDSVKPSKFDKEAVLSETGVLGLASSLVDCDTVYRDLVSFLLGRIVICDEIDNAIRLQKKYNQSLRIVTLDGEQLNPGGSLSGGAFRNSSNLLGRKRELDELTDAIKKAEEVLENGRRKLSDLRQELANVREELEDNNRIINSKELDLNTIVMQKKQIEDKLSDIDNEYNESKKENLAINDEIDEINASIVETSEAVKALDKKNDEIGEETGSLSFLISDEKDELEENKDKLESLNMSMASLTQQLEFARVNVERVREEYDDIIASLDSMADRKEDVLEAIKKKEEEIKKLKSDIEDYKNIIADTKKKIEELKAEKEVLSKEEKSVYDKRETANSAISDLEKDEYKLSNRLEKIIDSGEELHNYMWEEYELTLNVAKELRDEELTSIDVIKKKLNAIKNSIKALGSVNVNAIEQFKEVNERFIFLTGQRDDLVASEQELVKIIAELDEGMRKQFVQKLEEIRVEFDKVFKELFGGGKGEIELDEEVDVLEAGIRIISQPPGKKLQNMMQLSGGEKALTAIALLFAIQNLKPSPFCLLDEIEAALDDSNVGRYAQYLHKLTKYTQFIVITHRRGTMAQADRLYGITMQEKGVSTLVSVDLMDEKAIS